MIIAIAEIKPKRARYTPTLAELSLKDYDTFHCNIENETGRGVLLLMHNSLNAMEIKFKFQEAIFVEIPLSDRKKGLVGCIYRSPNSSSENNDELCKELKELNKEFDSILVMGDFNYKDIDWNMNCTPGEDTNSNEYKFMEIIKDCFMFQHVHKATRGRGDDIPSLLDMVLTNEQEMISTIDYNSPLGKSDHSVLEFVCQFNGVKKTKGKAHIKKCYNKADYISMRKEVDDKTEELKRNCPLEEKWNKFKETILAVEDKYTPKRSYNPLADNSKRSTPLEKETVTLIKKKHRLWTRYMETRDKKYHKEFCKTRNKVKTLTRKAKRDHEKSIALEAKNNPKKFWNYVKAKTKIKTGISNLEYTDDSGHLQITNTDKEKAEVLDKFFCSAYTKEPEGPIPRLENKVTIQNLNTVDINSVKVLKILTKLKTDKAPGVDRLHPRILCELSEQIVDPITNIMQTSLKTSSLPNDWRSANVSPIFKKGNKKSANNYRPVSLTSILCKCMEKIVRDEIVDHMIENDFFFK